jgi:hypothetical protein
MPILSRARGGSDVSGLAILSLVTMIGARPCCETVKTCGWAAAANAMTRCNMSWVLPIKKRLDKSGMLIER